MSGVAVVTGAGRGIGAAIARRLAGAGLEPLLVDLDPGVEQTAAGIDGTAGAVVADITDPAGRDAVRAAVGDRPLQALVNNAGITRDGRIGKMTEADFRAVIRINLGGAYEMTRVLLDAFADGGAIVNMSSRAYLANIGQFNYSASKGGLVGMTRALALELAPRIRVNAVAPGLTASEMTQAMPDRVLDKLVGAIPAGRMAQPEEIAEVVWALAAPGSSYVTGQVVVACGGRSLAP
ncbi:MAG: 3-oxoacyl-[acyl-carrier protein] reductase [Solirubrobacteraceae bacterium]|nr:3-oxoacyl-[acyl-carrier protein] reductase [Solirubrobacteraceae bacterium]MEA2318356.1 3-oxoacyl-[acyl-carrier protein] reductase [Solirubrobacteraceae bacterium]